ncbi:MAG: helix-turn-helix transcriptional regulator [Clostridiales bacterium]|nr:helix-turn-helix transcriptional regulator [Clostridiales bacterium]MBQ8308261.1 helix-turn-helix transcriptional regulator [Clostridia bacterium]
MTLRQKIDMACAYKGISQATLARALGITPATFNARLKVCKFSQEEMEKIAAALGCAYTFGFEFPDGTRI